MRRSIPDHGSREAVDLGTAVAALFNEGVGEWARVQARAERASLEKLKRVLSKVRDVPADVRDQL
jgi:hypothetical protein